MTILPPAPGEPRRPQGPRDPGDAWVVADSGERYWGRFGAAGLLALDPARGVLLQHRVGWSHFGGTWGLPGGALHEGEPAALGARREAQEEAGIPNGAVRTRFARVLDLEIWSYTTVVADVIVPFDPVISDPESVALEWVPVDEVDARPLHPGFGASWPELRALLPVHPVIVVDAANVVGSVPDGWWRDRAGAAARLRDSLTWLAVPAADLGLAGMVWYPEIVLVVEGAARGIEPSAPGVSVSRVSVSRVSVVDAEGSGDDAIVASAERFVAEGRPVVVVTSDRELRVRAEVLGAAARPVSWLRGLIGE